MSKKNWERIILGVRNVLVSQVLLAQIRVLLSLLFKSRQKRLLLIVKNS